MSVTPSVSQARIPSTHAVTGVRTEHADPTCWVATSRPRVSWRSVATGSDWTQSAADVRLVGDDAVIETVRLEGPASIFVAWPFAHALPEREARWIQVRTADADGIWSDWSVPLEARSAALELGRWQANPIASGTGAGIFRRELALRGPVRRATLYAAAQGVYQVSINGVDVDDHVLKPGWSSYDLRLPYETTDVTPLMAAGANVIGIRLAGGWYSERYNRHAHDEPTWGDTPSVACLLVVEYEDGTSEDIVTDGSWRTSHGEIVHTGIYVGESVDARLEPHGWPSPGFDDADWIFAVETEWQATPTPRIGPPVRAIEELPAVSAHVSPAGATILDFGQNIAGRLRVRVRAPRDTVLTLQHAEVLEHGELALRPLRAATATDTYVHDGVDRVWEPEFTFHGFRYASIDGLPGGTNPADVTAVVLHSEMTRTGWFDCSEPLVTKLHENVVWSMRDNFLHLPTDCPQRDERQGWTGDIQVFAPTAATLFDVGGFLASWLTDLRLEQEERGTVSFIVPDIVKRPRPPAAAWGDAATVVPSVLYERLGDAGVLADQFESMKGWVEQIRAAAGESRLWRGGFQFGDWLDPDSPPDDPSAAKVPAEIVATAYYAKSAGLVARAARTLGDEASERHYAALAEEVRSAWTDEYVDAAAGRVRSDAATAYALAIVFDLVQGDERVALAQRLVELLDESDYRVLTGFVGTPLLADALTSTGHDDAAARLLLQTECPSWLYPVRMGATTVWERWDSMLPDGTINPGEMTSFNHYALGAVADWLHRVVAGLSADAPGYSRIRVAPRPLAGLHRATSVIDTPYGSASVGWAETPDGSLRVEAEVPANTTAVVDLPGADEFAVGSGRHSWTIVDARGDPAEPIGVADRVGNLSS
ncbi:alpha-L-rhamnosidase [Microbacterium murale]|nr:alpha-L-rhamnosidase [Microbacterium murale]